MVARAALLQPEVVVTSYFDACKNFSKKTVAGTGQSHIRSDKFNQALTSRTQQ